MHNLAGLDASAKPSVQRAARSRSAGTLPAHKREKKIGRSWSGLCFDKAGRAKTTQFRRKRMVNPRRSAVTLLAVLLFAIPFVAQTPVAAPTGKAPGAVAGDVTTDYFGTKVADPYRWMEGSAEDPKFMAFLKAQNDYTRAVLASLNGREQLLARIRELDNAVPTVRSWQRGGSSIFYLETAPGAKTSSLMVRDADGKPRKLLHPTSMDKGDSHAAIDYFAPSWDGRYVIAGVSLGGSENSVIHVIESSTGRMLPDAITRTQYARPSWSVDSQSFYYARLQKLATDAPPSMVY